MSWLCWLLAWRREAKSTLPYRGGKERDRLLSTKWVKKPTQPSMDWPCISLGFTVSWSEDATLPFKCPRLSLSLKNSNIIVCPGQVSLWDWNYKTHLSPSCVSCSPWRDGNGDIHSIDAHSMGCQY